MLGKPEFYRIFARQPKTSPAAARRARATGRFTAKRRNARILL